MKVLSLFDGISCGQVALQRAGIPVEKYYASEIDKRAIWVTQKNFPNTVQIGDVTKTDFGWFEGEIDLLIGGSPCTNWSCAKNHTAKNKKETNINEGMGWELFCQYVRALHECKPRYFLYENNYRMPQSIFDEITRTLGTIPIMIDSALVSAQRRKRLYWTNIPGVEQPDDRQILWKDIYIPDRKLERRDPRITKTAIRTSNYIKYDLSGKGFFSQQNRLYFLHGKSPTVARCRTETKHNLLLDESDYSRYKIISPVEAERLQTLPDNYTEGLPKTARFEAIGNGWTVDVITHILKHIRN